MIPKLCWVKCGVSKENPDILKLDSDEIAGLIANTRAHLEITEDNKESEDEETVTESKISDSKEMEDKDPVRNPADEFNLENYDDEEEDEAVSQRMFGAGLSGVAYFANPEDDPYITLPQVAREEEETYEVKSTDNLICCAKLDGNMSTVEVHLWNGEEGHFYVHHDIILDTFPLSIEWLSYDAGFENEHGGSREPGNYVALGCMSPQIELWDLDIIDTSEPVATLGERRKQSNKIPKIGEKGHSDAVMDLSWNRQTQNVLASASADKHILLWDLESLSAKECLNHHSDKVQTLAWHLAEPTTILSGSYDQTCHVVDCRTKSSKKWKVDGEVEGVVWDVTNPFSFLAGTSSGNVYCIDIREEKPLYTLSAHTNEVSGIALTKLMPGLLATCSADKVVKVWDVSNNKPTCVASKEFPEASSLHCLAFCPDYPTMLAIGGLEGGLLMWDPSLNKEFREHFNIQ